MERNVKRMQQLISIIIPVYKSERYLKRCLNSVINQTYPELEIILVDDGSPDKCPVICDDYAEKDLRIKVIHKENGGVSSARNAGIDFASGDYICFVDSDDWMPEDSVKVLVEKIESTGCQFVAGVCVTDKGKIKNKIRNKKRIDFLEKPEELLSYICEPGSYSPYAKIYKTDLIKKYNIRYDENLKCSEDALMIRQYFKYCKSICLIPDIVYCYNTQNESSLSKHGYENFCFYFIKKLEALSELVETLPIDAEKKKQFLVQRAVHGLKISIDHYMNNWKEEKKQIELIGKSINAFDSWLFITELNNSSYLYRWWKKNMKDVKEKNVEKLLQYTKKEKACLKIIRFIKNKI